MNSPVLQLNQKMSVLFNKEQASIAVFTDVFCFAHAEYHLIKLKLYNN